MVSLAKYTITESRANVIVARALFFEHVFLAFLDIFELPATRPRPAALRQLFGSQAPANRLTPAAGSALAHCCARRTAHPSPRARRPPLLHPRDAAQEASPHDGRPSGGRRGRSAGRAGRQRSALGRPKHPHDIYQVRDCQTAVAYGSGVASSACTPLSRSASCQAAQARPDLTQPSSARLGLACPGQVVRHVTGECRSPAATARPCQAT